MKNALLITAIFLINSMCLAQFKLNTNPENPNRLPDPKEEVGIVLSKDSPQITIGGGNGKKSTNFLPAGVLVIVNKYTLVAKWVAICGNTVFTNWKPEGKIIPFTYENSYKLACEEMLDKLSNIENGVNELLDRPNYSLAELKTMFQKTLKENFQEQKETSSWKTGNTILLTTLSTVGGAVAAGYGFPKTTYTTKTIEGIRVQSGDGTIIFGPDETKIIKHTKFNPTAAVIGGIASGALTYLLCQYVF